MSSGARSGSLSPSPAIPCATATISHGWPSRTFPTARPRWSMEPRRASRRITPCGSWSSTVRSRSCRSKLSVARAKEHLGGPVKLMIAGKAHGFSDDYGHGDLTIGRRAPDEVFPVIESFLAASSTRI